MSHFIAEMEILLAKPSNYLMQAKQIQKDIQVNSEKSL